MLAIPSSTACRALTKRKRSELTNATSEEASLMTGARLDDYCAPFARRIVPQFAEEQLSYRHSPALSSS